MARNIFQLMLQNVTKAGKQLNKSCGGTKHFPLMWMLALIIVLVFPFVYTTHEYLLYISRMHGCFTMYITASIAVKCTMNRERERKRAWRFFRVKFSLSLNLGKSDFHIANVFRNISSSVIFFRVVYKVRNRFHVI